MMHPRQEGAGISAPQATARVLGNACRVLRRAALLVQVVLLVAVVVACGPAASPPQPPPPPTKAQCQKALANAKGPVFCIPSPATRLFVVGLPAAHGWRRADWALVEVLQKGFSKPTPAAMVEVVNAYPDAVEVHLLYQAVSNVSLDGAAARLPGKDERVRLGKFVGHVAKVELTGVQLDIGSDDHVAVGDVYQVLSRRDHTPIGRVRITEVSALSARAVKIDVREELLPQMDVVYLKDGAAHAKEAVRIVVANFDPHDSQDATETKTGRTFAKDLADALAKAADKNDMTVSYAENERVPFGTGDAEGHKKAQQIGERLGADIVVWGQMSCNVRACAVPRFTVVSPNRLRLRSYGGPDVLFERDASGGFAFKGKAPGDPLALAAALLGSAAISANRFADAAFYLEHAIASGVLQGEDQLQGRCRLAFAMFIRGQMVAARAQAETLLAKAQSPMSPYWIGCARTQLALVDKREGSVSAAQRNFEAMRESAVATGDDSGLGMALHWLGILKMDQGQVEEARTLFQQSLDVKRRANDVGGKALTLHQLAKLEIHQGRIDEGRKLHGETLDIMRRVGDVQGEAVTLKELGKMEARQGRIEEAKRFFLQSLECIQRIGDVDGEAGALHGLARLEIQSGNTKEAKRLLQQSLGLSRRVGNIRSQAATLHELGYLEVHDGRVDEARRLYRESLDLAQRVGNVEGELPTLVNLAGLDYNAGKRVEARRAYLDALDRARAMQYVEYQAEILDGIAYADFREGDYRQARIRWIEAKALFEKCLAAPRAANIEESLTMLASREKAGEAWKVHEALLTSGGVLVIAVRPDGQAARVGLEAGDVLIRYGTAHLDKPETLQGAAKAADPKKTFSLELLRGAKKVTVSVKGGPLGVSIDVLPPKPQAVASAPAPSASATPAITPASAVPLAAPLGPPSKAQSAPGVPVAASASAAAPARPDPAASTSAPPGPSK